MTKMFRHAKSFGMVAMAMLLSGALLLGPVVPAKAELEERVVKLGFCSLFTGPLATIGKPYGEGLLDYAKYVNEQGGINGIKVEIPWYETKGSIALAIPNFRKLVEQGIVLVHTDTVCEGIVHLLQREEIPAIGVTALTPRMISKPQWIVTSLSDWPTVFMTEVKWVKETLWTGGHPLRVGAIIFDFPIAYPTLDAVKYFDRIGVEFVGHEIVPFACVDASVELLRLVNKKSDWIFLNSYGMSTATVIKDTARLGLQEKGIKFMAFPNTLDECTLAVVGKAAEGWYSCIGTPCYFEHKRFLGLKTLTEVAKRYRGIKPEDIKGFYIGGWAHSAVGVEAIRLAIEKAGYENLTGRDVRDAVMSIKGFDTGVVPPITIRENAPAIIDIVGMYQVREGSLCPIARVESLPSLYMLPQEFERALEK